MTLSLPKSKVKQIVAECWETPQRESVSVRIGQTDWQDVSGIAGSPTGTAPVLEPPEGQEQGLQKDTVIQDGSEPQSGVELKGGAFVIQTFAKGLRDAHISGQHNSNFIYQQLDLARSALDLWHWCLDRGIILSAEHLPGTQNVAADLESRTLGGSVEWQLHPEVCKRIIQERCRVRWTCLRPGSTTNSLAILAGDQTSSQ